MARGGGDVGVVADVSMARSSGALRSKMSYSTPLNYRRNNA